MLLEAAVDADDDVDLRFQDEFIRVLGPVMAEHTPVTLAEAAAWAAGMDPRVLVATLPSLREGLTQVLGLPQGLTREAVGVLSRAEALLQQCPGGHTRSALAAALEKMLARLADELSRLHAPVAVAVGEALPVARWMFGEGPPPRGAAVLELARRLDEFCRRAPLAPPDLEALRELARQADTGSGTPGWRLVLERLRTVRPRLLPLKPLPPLYRSLAGAPVRVSRVADSLEALLRE
ncbi:MAG: hypothetical protein EOO71_19355 [Myxococcaceae bacterium]|nr:MAG: hypothetical protein EOO71_19355 [Myxococcaceae bacterium]